MKKLISIMAATSVLLPAGTASAATKCVALNSSTTCTSNTFTNKTDWKNNCTTNGTSLQISGVSVCASTSGSAEGETADNLEITGNVESDRYCWCKMTSPAVSSWVYRYDHASAVYCAEYCAYACNTGTSDDAYHTALFSNLSD